ncbi:MAG: TetR/AcrR family transcriptional regulator [Betaproteobacteria bacterium]|nr:MAG: TetR/AcrR family transcriptional regulator [Betaproteobacteria bacterium]
MRYDTEHKQRTRERVLKEAAAAIRAEGPERIAVAGVMKRAGLTHGGFYAHFASKDELVVAAIEHSFAEAFEAFGLFTRGRPPAAGLAAYIDFYLSPWHCERRGEGCPLPALAADLPRLAAPAREAFERGAARLTSAIAEHLQVLGQPHAGRLAVSVLSEMVGAVVLARSIADGAHALAILDASRTALKTRLGLTCSA